jgi:short subunit dehydrogenase-like uncharacterized protein
MKQRVERATPGPSELRRQDSGCYVWGEVTNAAGKPAKRLKGPNGYDLHRDGVARHRATPAAAPPRGGYHTPSLLMGADYVAPRRLIEST